MKHKSYLRSRLLLIASFGILLFLLIAAVLIDQTQKGISGEERLQPTLSNLSVKLAPLDKKTSRGGDLIFTLAARSKDKDQDKAFVEFGAHSSTGNLATNPGLSWLNLAPDTVVSAAAAGLAYRVEYVPASHDYSIYTHPSADSPWDVIYSHLNALSIKAGDKLQPGQKIGLAAPNPSKRGLAYASLTIVKYSDLKNPQTRFNEYFCPLSLMSRADQKKYSDQLTQAMLDWRAFSGNASQYAIAAMPLPGCNYRSFNYQTVPY